jgi:hypothetical protein
MNGMLYGRNPRDEWSMRADGVMPTLDDARLAAQEAMYDLLIRKFGHLQYEEMTACAPCGEKATRATDADGTEVVADFDSETLQVNGKTVARPEALAPAST